MVIFGDVGRRPDDRISDVFRISWFMFDEPSARIKTHFASLTDPRRRKVTHPLINIVTIAAWARQKQAWLAKILDLSNGIPSHDCFNAIFKAIKPDEFERCLLSWLASLPCLPR